MLGLVDRLAYRTKETDTILLEELLASAKAAILARRYPFGEYPSELEDRYVDLQLRMAEAAYNKIGADYESSHTENGITRHWDSEGFPEILLQEITPICKKVGGKS